MPYFFFSYAGANAQGKADAHVRRFVEDLQEEIRQWAQPPVQGEIVFRDWDNISTGDNLPQKLGDALRTCKVFVPLYSPHYFMREACGKEWHAFTERLAEYARTSSNNPQELPPLIMPVWWVPVDLQKYGLPASITSLKHNFDELGQRFGKTYKDDGLRQILRLNNRKYKDFVTRFARRMIAGCNAHALKDAQTLNWDELPNAFKPVTAAPTSPTPAGPGHVEFLIAAGCASQFAHAPVRKACYGDRPEHWRPFHPQFGDCIGPLVQAIAIDVDLTPLLVDVGPGLGDRLKQAKNKQNIVVLLVDPWSLDVAGIADHLREYDESDLSNCTAFVIWNDDDVETQQKRTALKQKVMEIFDNKTAPGHDTNTFRDDINSLKKLEDDLARTLIEIKQRIVDRGEVMGKAEGKRPIALSQVQGPGGIPTP